MDDSIDILLRLIDEAFDRKSWHGTNLRGSLRGLTVADVVWRPQPQRHNIWEAPFKVTGTCTSHLHKVTGTCTFKVTGTCTLHLHKVTGTCTLHLPACCTCIPACRLVSLPTDLTGMQHGAVWTQPMIW